MKITEYITEVRPGEHEIEEFCRFSQTQLPEDYKAFLKNENGGRPDPCNFRLTNHNGGLEEGGVDFFLALYDGKIGSLKMTFTNFKGRLPAGFLAIGRDPFGNLILLKTSGDNFGKIYFWDHEKEDSEPTLNNVFFVSDSFSEFIGNLFHYVITETP